MFAALYEPPTPSPHNYYVVYLHCSESASLARLSGVRARVRSTRPARHRTRHRSKLVDRPHLAGVRCCDFGRSVRAAARCSVRRASVGTPGRRGSRCWASAWAARARSGWRTNIPTCFRRWPRSRRRSIFRSGSTKASIPAWNSCTAMPKTPGRTRRCCTFIRSTGRGTSSSAAIRPTCAGTTRPNGCG